MNQDGTCTPEREGRKGKGTHNRQGGQPGWKGSLIASERSAATGLRKEKQKESHTDRQYRLPRT